MLRFVTAAVEASHSPRVGEALSGIFGSVSLTAWICLLLPQLITNYKAKSADALSMKFLLIWLLGDICNLSGALFTSLAPSTIALASYFCVADLILISQCTYYNTINARRRAARREHHPHHHHHHHHTHPSSSTTAADDDLDASTSSAVVDAPPPSESDPLLPNDNSSTRRPRADSGGGLPGSHRRHEIRRRDSSGLVDPLTRIITGEDDTPDSQPWLHNTMSLVAVWVVGAAGWFVSYKMGAWGVGVGDGGVLVPGDGEGGELMKEPVAVVGMVLGYASALCYLCARIPQIIKNYREKSCEGLALLFFLLSLTGNFTYGASVMAYSQERDYFVRALPWLLGSLGTMVEDCVIFVQFRIYSPTRQAKAAGSV
ncbi:putative vacuolar amino acid transporter YPQ1 [Parachaetomium inaequale]|uniref:Vacuolar amino acid transporter YPQ1 n=1 Tax=Parachaetomium inaequale TaxID=2588326 RepID=A0AAN6PIR1_9PEZI|nr:putative vacuolar amino acid transporter YPQ1 [Parachaetomium inaequale]